MLVLFFRPSVTLGLRRVPKRSLRASLAIKTLLELRCNAERYGRRGKETSLGSMRAETADFSWTVQTRF